MKKLVIYRAFIILLACLTGCQSVGDFAVRAPYRVVCVAVGTVTDVAPRRGPQRSEDGRPYDSHGSSVDKSCRCAKSRETRSALHGTRPDTHEQMAGPREPILICSASESVSARLIALYDECQYQECLKEAELLLRRATASAQDRAAACLFEGAILCIYDRNEEAAECFRRVRELDPYSRPDPARFKPAVVACFDAAVVGGR